MVSESLSMITMVGAQQQESRRCSGVQDSQIMGWVDGRMRLGLVVLCNLKALPPETLLTRPHP